MDPKNGNADQAERTENAENPSSAIGGPKPAEPLSATLLSTG